MKISRKLSKSKQLNYGTVRCIHNLSVPAERFATLALSEIQKLQEKRTADVDVGKHQRPHTKEWEIITRISTAARRLTSIYFAARFGDSLTEERDGFREDDDYQKRKQYVEIE
ncbi:hypothetical protein Trydic_g15196 [Trypoxylus dichotomus]